MMKPGRNICVEKRKRLRTAFNTDVVVSSSNGRFFKGYLNNISINGMFVDCETLLSPGSACKAEIRLLGKRSVLILSVSGTVVRKAYSGFGIQFDHDLEWWSLFTVFSSYGKAADNFIPSSFFEAFVCEGV
ncbi:PilZ domain-containing protein [Desulfonema limicola]|uniref:PilZ domain-containing protein n=2 Tax=Desulfonema limicola TaxID=45656 RepID=A0A975GF28_9BACT|nr:PilZ domain-containing protein [Desulfonema limicola]